MITDSFPVYGTLLDSSSSPTLQKLFEFPYDRAVDRYLPSSVPDNGSYAQALPQPTCYKLYVRNNDPVATLTVQWTPVGASQDQATVLNPGGFLMLVDPIGAGGGYTGVTLSSSNAAGQSFEIFMGQ